MSSTERTPLLVGNKELPPFPSLYHNCPTTSISPTMPLPATTTPSPQCTEDKVDGVLFNNSAGSAAPDVAVVKGHVPHPYQEKKDLVSPPQSVGAIKVYYCRFWILISFSFLGMFQCMMWNTWGPLSASVNAAYPGWGSSTVAMMGNWGTITFVLFVVPMCWIMNTKGLRVGALVCAVLVAGGTVLRIVPLLVSTNVTFFTVMCHVCAILVGISGTLIMAAPPLIAAIWFPPEERTTATAFGQVLNMLGNSGSYLEPLMVREPSSETPGPEEVKEIQDDIKRLLYIWAGIGVGMLVVLLAYFPSKPPLPPSITSHVERLDFKGSARRMMRNGDLLLVTVAYGMSVGVPSAWASVLNYSLYELGMTQSEAMWVGLVGTIMTGFLTLLVGRFTDIIYGHIKLTLVVFFACDLACFYWFFLLTWHSIPVTTWQIYVTVVGGLSFNFGLSPLFFELAVESAYPCSEVMVGGIMTAANNFVGLCFLFLFLVPFENYQWVTYVLLTTLAAALVPFVFVKEDYSRSNIDCNSLVSAHPPI